MSRKLIDEAKIKILDGFSQTYDAEVESLIKDPNMEFIMKQFARTVHQSLSEVLDLIEKLEEKK